MGAEQPGEHEAGGGQGQGYPQAGAEQQAGPQRAALDHGWSPIR
jgi:hypothetical protein